MSKTKIKLTIILLAILLCTSLTLTGCKDTEKEKAPANVEAAKAELAKVKTDFAQITSERNNLKLELDAVIEARDKLQAAADQTMNIKAQLDQIIRERDSATAKLTDAQAMVQNLNSQLNEQILKANGLEAQNKKLMEMIDELKKKLGTGPEIPSIPKI